MWSTWWCEKNRRSQRRVPPPLAHLFEQRPRVVHGAGIEHHEAIAGIDRVRAGDALVVEHPVRDFLANRLAERHRVKRLGIDIAVPELFGQFANGGHVAAPRLVRGRTLARNMGSPQRNEGTKGFWAPSADAATPTNLVRRPSFLCSFVPLFLCSFVANGRCGREMRKDRGASRAHSVLSPLGSVLGR